MAGYDCPPLLMALRNGARWGTPSIAHHPQKPDWRRGAIGTIGTGNKRDGNADRVEGQHRSGSRRAEPAPAQRIVMMIMMMQRPHQGEKGYGEHHAHKEQGALWCGQFHAAEDP